MVLLVLYNVSTSACLLTIAGCSVHGDISHTMATHLQYDAEADRLVMHYRSSRNSLGMCYTDFPCSINQLTTNPSKRILEVFCCVTTQQHADV